MDIITTHITADFDALASIAAAKKLYPSAEIVFPGSQERKVRDFIEVFKPIEIKRIKDVKTGEISRLVIVDTKKKDRIGQISQALSNKGLVVHIFDHHPFEEDDIRGDLEKIEEVGATATIFTEMLKSRKLHPTPMEATLLALGIYEETGSLLFPSTTERDLLALSYLLKKGANLNIVSTYLRMDLSMVELDLLNELVKTSSELVIRGVRIGIATASPDIYIGDAAHLAHRIMDMKDIDAVFVLLDMEGKILVVARSRAPELDTAELMKEFGGGGHPTAASATIREASTAVVADRLKTLLHKLVKPGKVASDIMTSPVITIRADSSIKEAEDTMTRYGVNVLPLLKDGKYAGLISRETVEKALFHGLRKNRCSEFASGDAVTVSAGSPIRDIETMMIERNQRFMPVLKADEIVGAITRTDLLRVMYEEFLRKRHFDGQDMTERTTPGRNIGTWLAERFPSEVHRILKTAGEIAETTGCSAYLVGGSVRDLLLGRENLDIDIVVEGDGIAFAKELAEKMSGAVRSHPRFGTAHVIIGGLKLDVATARTEYYESPAALPKVEMSSIKKDLYRRDFSINTLAVRLNRKDFGLLIDFFGGQRDLREKTIRVLHNLSLVEDPTRAFRAVRFAERFGFKISRHTEDLIRSALQMDLFEKLSGTRIYDELMLAFHETNPVRTLKRLSSYGLLRVIHKDLVFDEKLEALLESLHETIAWHNLLYLGQRSDVGILSLMAILSRIDEPKRIEALLRLAVPPKASTAMTKRLAESAEILKRLPLRDPAEIYHLLIGSSIETVLFSMASTSDTNRKKEISLFLIDLRKVRPLLTGHDLLALGIPEGPVYAEILEGLMVEKLRGRLKTADDERDFVRKRYLKG